MMTSHSGASLRYSAGVVRRHSRHCGAVAEQFDRDRLDLGKQPGPDLVRCAEFAIRDRDGYRRQVEFGGESAVFFDLLDGAEQDSQPVAELGRGVVDPAAFDRDVQV